MGKPARSNQKTSETHQHSKHTSPFSGESSSILRLLACWINMEHCFSLLTSAPPHSFSFLCLGIAEVFNQRHCSGRKLSRHWQRAGGYAEWHEWGTLHWCAGWEGSHWNPTWAGAVTDREMTGVLRAWAVPEKSLRASWFLHEWFSRRTDLCYSVECMPPLSPFPKHWHPTEFYSPLSSPWRGMPDTPDHPCIQQ